MGGIDGALMEGVMANLSSVLQQAATDHGKRPAVRMDGLVLSYLQLWDAARRLTSLLASLKIVPGDRVALMLPNVPAFPIAFYGVLGAGAVVVPVNPLLKSREVAHCLGDSGARVLFAWHSVAGEAAKGAAETGTRVVEVAEPDLSGLLAGVAPVPGGVERPGDDAVILYTSGTTGKPKGAELMHAGLIRNAELTATTLLNAGPDDVIMGCLPLFHSFGLTCALNVTIISGSTLTLLPSFDPGKALGVIGRDKVTIFEGVPTIGVPHDELGEEVGAAVALKPGATATPADLRAFAREQMAPYKYPRYVWLVPGLPKGATGKILRREVHPPEEF